MSSQRVWTLSHGASRGSPWTCPWERPQVGHAGPSSPSLGRRYRISGSISASGPGVCGLLTLFRLAACVFPQKGWEVLRSRRDVLRPREGQSALWFVVCPPAGGDTALFRCLVL